MLKVYLLLVTLVIASSAQALRCDGKLIAEGDHQYRVAKLCGPPAFSSTRSEFRTRSLHQAQGRIELEQYNQHGIHYEQGEEILIEEWIYDFGRNRLNQKIYFENSQVITIESLGYGD